MRGVQYASRNHSERGRRGESSAVCLLHPAEILFLPGLSAHLLAGHAPAEDAGGVEGFRVGYAWNLMGPRDN